jgi:hypothetical protein
MGTDPVLAEYLPVLYRVALDAVDELARRGGRTEAARLRRAAGRAYSRSWDDRCRRALEGIVTKAHAASGTPPPPLPLAAFVA